MSAIEKQQFETIKAVAVRLYERHHLLTIYHKVCTLPPLSEVELTVLCVWRFRSNIFSSGWEGFLVNTENQFGDFVPTALTAIGAHNMAAVARDALRREEELAKIPEEEVTRRKLRNGENRPFYDCRDDIWALLYRYWQAHKSELPSAEPVSKQELNDYEIERERLLEEKQQRLPEFRCPSCLTLYHSEKDEGECPLCMLSRKCGLPRKTF